MIYFAQADGTDLVKIGFTAGDAIERVSDLQTGCPHKLSVLAAVEGGERDEARWHKEFAAERVQGEWFRLTPRLMVRIVLAAAGDRAELLRRIGAVEEALLRVERQLGSATRDGSGTGGPAAEPDALFAARWFSRFGGAT